MSMVLGFLNEFRCLISLLALWIPRPLPGDDLPHSTQQMVPIAKVIIDGSEYEAILDSASDFVVIDEELADDLHMDKSADITVSTAKRNRTSVRHGLLNLSVCLTESVKTEAIVLPLKEVAETLQTSSAIIVGMPVLRNGVLDLRAQDGPLFQMEACEFPDSETLGIEIVGGIPRTSMFVKSIGEVVAIIDTGNGGSLQLSPELADRLLAAKAAIRGPDYGQVTAAGFDETRTVLVQSVQLGNHEFRNVLATVGRSNLIGCALLKRMQAVLDFRSKLIHVQSGRHVHRVPMNGSGISVVFGSRKDLLVGTVAWEDIDVQPGDRVLLINGRSPETCTLMEVEEMLGRSHDSAQLLLERDGSQIDLTLPIIHEIDDAPDWDAIQQSQKDFQNWLERRTGNATDKKCD